MIKTLQTLIYPHKCIVCRCILPHENTYVCHKCSLGALWHNLCQRCGRPYAVEDEPCMYCKDMHPGIKRMIGAFPYTKHYKKSVLRWKYQGIRKYGRGFAYSLLRQAMEIKDLDILVPVPLAKSRYRKRGFNQALDLANELSSLMDVPIGDILERYKYTKPQSACTKEERKQNIRHTIRVKENKGVKQKVNKIAIIDDIYTTGSTIYECIRAIMEVYKEDDIQVYVIVACIAV